MNSSSGKSRKTMIRMSLIRLSSCLFPLGAAARGTKQEVTLVGFVATDMDKNIAGMTANGVPGVLKVTNNLRVENETP